MYPERLRSPPDAGLTPQEQDERLLEAWHRLLQHGSPEQVLAFVPPNGRLDFLTRPSECAFTQVCGTSRLRSRDLLEALLDRGAPVRGWNGDAELNKNASPLTVLLMGTPGSGPGDAELIDLLLTRGASWSDTASEKQPHSRAWEIALGGRGHADVLAVFERHGCNFSEWRHLPKPPLNSERFRIHPMWELACLRQSRSKAIEQKFQRHRIDRKEATIQQEIVDRETLEALLWLHTRGLSVLDPATYEEGIGDCSDSVIGGWTRSMPDLAQLWARHLADTLNQAIPDEHTPSGRRPRL